MKHYWDKPLSPTYGSPVTATLRFAAFFIMILLVVPVHAFYSVLKPNDPHRLPLLFHRLLLKVIGFRVRTHGAMATTAPVFFVANHVSYLDVPVLGALIPASFIAKAEVERWPVFGFLAKLQGTVFIERRSNRAGQQRDVLNRHLASGRNLILFPEGTSSDGQTVLPFKSSLFGAIETAAEDIDVLVQPVSIACTALDGLPLTQNLRHIYGWYGDLSLMPHMWQAFKCDRFDIDVIFHPPIHARTMRDRKQLALACHDAVARGIEQCVTGRWTEADRPPDLITAPV